MAPLALGIPGSINIKRTRESTEVNESVKKCPGKCGSKGRVQKRGGEVSCYMVFDIPYFGSMPKY